MTGILNGVRVIDFSWVGAGSFTTRLLAEHGADVVKIESGTNIDSLRLGPPFARGEPGVNRSGYFAERNANKRSVVVNVKDPRGREIVHRLIADADVVANNFRPGVMDKLGMSYEVLRGINPRLIYLSMSMQGASGPERDYSGYGITIAATTGLTHLSGEPGRYPVGTGTHYPDHVPNPTHAALAVLAAIRHQRRTGQGQAIELAQTEPMIAMLGPAVLEWTARGTEPGPAGNRHPQWCPHGVFPALGDDNWIAIAVRKESEWQALCSELGLSSQLASLALADRRARIVDIEAAVAERTATRSGSELMHALQKVSVPAGVVQTAADLVDRDAQLEFRGHWVRLAHAEMGESLYGVAPMRFSASSGELTSAAPLLGEHTRQILIDELGFDDKTLDDLERSGVLN